MSLKNYQQQIDDSVRANELSYWTPMSNLARLIEEVGEVARIVNHHFGEKPKKGNEELSELGDELADVIYSALCMANSQGIEMDEPMKRAIAKLETRDKDRFKKN